MTEIQVLDPFLVDIGGSQHLVTYAEEGFSPLSTHLKHYGYSKNEIVSLADDCNQQGESKNLLPELPITIIPRFLVREDGFEIEFESIITKIIDDCDVRYRTTAIFFDFGVPDIPVKIEWFLRMQLESRKTFKNLKFFGFVGSANRSNLPDLFTEVNNYSASINIIFQRKNFSLLRSGYCRFPRGQEVNARHWFQLAGKIHGVDLLQPRHVKFILNHYGIGLRGSHYSDYSLRSALPRFLAIMIITNYISQLAHSNKFELRQTFGKIILFPEIVGDCPGACDFHFRPIRFAEIVVSELSKISGPESANLVQVELDIAIERYRILVMNLLDTLLERLVSEDDIEPCKRLVLENLERFDKPALR